MNNRFFTIALGAFLFLNPLQINAQGLGVAVDSTDALPNQLVCLPVYAQGFTNILSFQYSLTWDAAVLSFDHVENFNLPDLNAAYFHSNAPNRLLVGWADPSGASQTKPNGAVLYEACFKVIALVGNSTDVTPGGDGFPPGTGSAEAYNSEHQNIWTPALIVPGYVEIVAQSGTSGTLDALQSEKNAFQLNPNPTQSTSQVTFHAETSGASTLSVTDASGRLVYDSKVAVKAGKNTVEIPAKALAAKGMYQVTLQNGASISSQLLSVQ